MLLPFENLDILVFINFILRNKPIATFSISLNDYTPNDLIC